MLSVIFIVLGTLVTITIVVGIHELSHFFIARLFNIKIIRFSLGFGHPLWRRQASNGVEYVIGLIPLGGYVRLLDTRNSEVTPEERSQAFDTQPVWKRFYVLVAGIIANIILAIACFWLIYFVGVIRPAPVIYKIIPNTPAAVAGVSANERFISIDGAVISDWNKAAFAIINRIGDTGKMQIKTQAGGKINNYQLNLADWKIHPLKPKPLQSLGMLPKKTEDGKVPIVMKRYNFFPAFGAAVSQFNDVVYLNLNFLYKIITGKISFQALGGFFTLAEVSGMALQSGVIPFIEFLGIVSLLVALINSFPIPGLDGGQLLFLGLEAIRKKPLSNRLESLLVRLAIIFFVVLVIQVTLNDLLRWFY